jgi:hypothetical protein
MMMSCWLSHLCSYYYLIDFTSTTSKSVEATNSSKQGMAGEKKIWHMHSAVARCIHVVIIMVTIINHHQ